LKDLLARFHPIALQEMQGVKLLDRFDTKFTFRIDQLSEILEELRPHYRVLEVDGLRGSHYENLYFDTDRLALYAKHHSGRSRRYKVRYRRYSDSGLCFFELKLKNNKGRTVKPRIPRTAIEPELTGEPARLLEQETELPASLLKPTLWVRFTRLTFVASGSPERLTIDFDLAYSTDSAQIAFPKLGIAEVKQDKSSATSHFIQMMRQQRIWEGSMSKYCFGVIHLYPDVKMNLFKERLRQLHHVAA
jgi:VTC domain